MRFGSSVAAVRDEDPSLELNHRAVCQQEDNSDALPLRLLDIDTESVLAWLDASLSSPSMKMSPISYDAEDLALPEFVSTTPCQSVVSSAEVADVHTGVVDGTSDSIEVLASQDDRHEDHCVKNESGWSSTTSTKQPRVYTKARIEALKKEIDLLTLHLERERSSRECELYLRSSLELGTRKRYASLWKPIAMRQQKHREDAEKTNARLRELIHAQRRRVRQITRSLHLRTCHPVSVSSLTRPIALQLTIMALTRCVPATSTQRLLQATPAVCRAQSVRSRLPRYSPCCRLDSKRNTDSWTVSGLRQESASCHRLVAYALRHANRVLMQLP